MKTYLLTWVHCGRVTIVRESLQVELIQLAKSQLSKQPQYKKGKFEIRTKEGFNAKKILNP